MIYDAIVIGAGVSGSFMARNLAASGRKVLILEAGQALSRSRYPRNEMEANATLYWGGGVELNSSATLGLLRPKVVGGGSVVNQALLDPFDEMAFADFRKTSGLSLFKSETFASYYEIVKKDLVIREITKAEGNENAHVFEQGHLANGFICAPLKRGQSACSVILGNDCMECLFGCPLDSKQSMPVTVLRAALKLGAKLLSEFEVNHLRYSKDLSEVGGTGPGGKQAVFKAKKIILASGAIGNSKLLLKNQFQKKLPAVGKNFYTHPQFMVLALYDKKINAHKHSFQSLKSEDPHFRSQGFKLENVFAPPVGVSMLLSGFGKSHHAKMRQYTHMACIEAAIRDTNPGEISLTSSGRVRVIKELNDEDLKRKNLGLKAIDKIFESTGAKEIIRGDLGIGLHLMGGCGAGIDPNKSVVTDQFTLHDHEHIHCADSSVFPNAPGINPSLTIMAMSQMASDILIKGGV